MFNFTPGAQERPKCVLISLTRNISMQCLSKHSHGELHRVPRFIELSLYLPFNFAIFIHEIWNIYLSLCPLLWDDI